MWGLRWLVALSVSGAAVMPAAGPAHAQTGAQIASAKKWFSDGLALEEKGQFAEALELFKKAAEVKRTPQILFHVALCQAKTGALVEARSGFELAIESSKQEKNAQVESAARAEIDALEKRIPRLVLALGAGSTPERVTIDDREQPLGALDAPVPLNPGAHRVKAVFAAGTVERSVELAEGSKVTLELVPPGAEAGAPVVAPPADDPSKPAKSPERPAPAPVAPSPSGPPQADSSRSTVLPWVLVGSGVVLAAGGFYAWKLRGDKIDELDAICPEGEDRCPGEHAGEVDDLESQGKTYNALAIGLWGAGAAALATGTILLLGSSSERAPAARFSPAVGPGVAGGFVSGRF